jgi:hypothetical protein
MELKRRQVLQGAVALTKNKALNGDRRIFSDKIIDIKRNPTLAQVQMGLDTVLKGKHGFLPVATAKHTKKSGFSSSTAQGTLAREFLETMGVFQTTHPTNHTLLRCDQNRPEVKNPYIIIHKTFEMLENSPISIQENFKDPNDPIFVISKPILTNKDYVTETELITGNVIRKIDLSAIASGVSALNISKSMPKKNKYFQSNQKISIDRTIRVKQYQKKYKFETLQAQSVDTYDPNKNTQITQLIIDEQKTNKNINYGPYYQGNNFISKHDKKYNKQKIYDKSN